MSHDAEYLHKLLVEKETLLHISCAGAGTHFLQSVWSSPGASAYLVGSFFAYAKTQMHAFLGHEPVDSYVTRTTAIDMAMCSYLRAVEHKVTGEAAGNPLGIGITAAVASTTLPRGKQRVHIAAVSKDKVLYFECDFEKDVGRGARVTQDMTITADAWLVLETALTGNDPTGEVQDVSKEALDILYQYPVFHTDGTRLASLNREETIYLPATLNPIHEGHRTMCRAAESHLGPGLSGSKLKAVYLVSSMSPHKGSLTVQEMLDRAGRLRAERWLGESRTLEFTHDEPLFLDKARKRPGSYFIIGADTMARMLDPKWGPDIVGMLREMKDLKVKFLVLGRNLDGKWTTCDDIAVPWAYHDLFVPLEGRLDISSTQIREATNV